MLLFKDTDINLPSYTTSLESKSANKHHLKSTKDK